MNVVLQITFLIIGCDANIRHLKKPTEVNNADIHVGKFNSGVSEHCSLEK